MSRFVSMRPWHRSGIRLRAVGESSLRPWAPGGGRPLGHTHIDHRGIVANIQRSPQCISAPDRPDDMAKSSDDSPCDDTGGRAGGALPWRTGCAFRCPRRRERNLGRDRRRHKWSWAGRPPCSMKIGYPLRAPRARTRRTALVPEAAHKLTWGLPASRVVAFEHAEQSRATYKMLYDSESTR